MTATLVWDLRQSATRATLLEQTLAVLPETDRAVVLQRTDAASVPSEHHHNLAAVLRTIDVLAVSDCVKEDMRALYGLLAEAEAEVHHTTVEKTHFHEVGNGDAVRGALGICLAIEAVDPQEIVATPIQTGQGSVQCAHGELSIPAPATAALIARGIPVCETTLDGELCTPTSAAIILHFVNRFVS